MSFYHYIMFSHADVSRGVRHSAAFVCLMFLRTISQKTDAARITKLDRQNVPP